LIFGKKKDYVLIVDDSPTVVEMLSHILAAKYNVLKATSGKEAIEIARKSKPKVVVMDARMPEIDGWMACKIIKETAATKKIKVLMCTGASKGKEVKKAFNMGADSFIMKPVVPSKLLAKVNELM